MEITLQIQEHWYLIGDNCSVAFLPLREVLLEIYHHLVTNRVTLPGNKPSFSHLGFSKFELI